MRQSRNNLVVIGTLKSKTVKTGKTANNEATISVEVVVSSDFEGKVHENKLRFWAKESSKLYGKYMALATEYKTLDEHGAEADRVKIDGTLEMNEYVNRNGDYKVFNNLRGVFIDRITNPEVKDEVGAVVECVVLGYGDEISKTGTPTGRKRVSLYTVGYNNSISELQNVFVESHLASQLSSLYQPNSTGELFIKVNNYVEVEQKEGTVKPTLGFGVTLDNMPSDSGVIKNYISDLIIIGGHDPKVLDKYTLEEINEMKNLREMSKQEKLNVAPQPPVQSSAAFGSGLDAFSNITTNDFEDPFA